MIDSAAEPALPGMPGTEHKEFLNQKQPPRPEIHPCSQRWESCLCTRVVTDTGSDSWPAGCRVSTLERKVMWS